MNKRLGMTLVVLVGATLGLTAHSATVTLYGTDFNVVYDSTQLGLFGTPQLIGDYLVFTPNAFVAQSLNGAGTVTTSSLAQDIQLVAHPGYQFGDIKVEAVGDYLMQGPGTSVGVSGSFTAQNAALPASQTVAPLVVGSPLNIANGIVQNWAGTAAVSGTNPWIAQAGTIDVSLSNILTATTTPGNGNSQAFIQEKFSSVELVIDPMQTPVPLPGTLWMALSGLAGLALFGRRAARSTDRVA